MVIFDCLSTFVKFLTPEVQPLLGDASAEFKVFLPKEKCQAITGEAFEKLSGIFWGVVLPIWHFCEVLAPEDQPLLDDASAEFKVFLPKEKCQANVNSSYSSQQI